MLYKSMFFMSHVIKKRQVELKENAHERIERHKTLKSLLVRAFPLFLLIIVIKIPLRKAILALAFQHPHSLPLQELYNTSSINCLLSDITCRHISMCVGNFTLTVAYLLKLP